MPFPPYLSKPEGGWRLELALYWSCVRDTDDPQTGKDVWCTSVKELCGASETARVLLPSNNGYYKAFVAHSGAVHNGMVTTQPNCFLHSDLEVKSFTGEIVLEEGNHNHYLVVVYKKELGWSVCSHVCNSNIIFYYSSFFAAYAFDPKCKISIRL